MIYQDNKFYIFRGKLNAGGDGGDGGDGGSGLGEGYGGSGSTGNYGGAATGRGASGYGGPNEGTPGIFGGAPSSTDFGGFLDGLFGPSETTGVSSSPTSIGSALGFNDRASMVDSALSMGDLASFDRAAAEADLAGLGLSESEARGLTGGIRGADFGGASSFGDLATQKMNELQGFPALSYAYDYTKSTIPSSIRGALSATPFGSALTGMLGVSALASLAQGRLGGQTVGTGLEGGGGGRDPLLTDGRMPGMIQEGAAATSDLAAQIAGIYENQLGRTPTADELSYWLNDAMSGSTPVNPQNVEAAIMNAAAEDELQSNIVQQYINQLGYLPEFEGLQYWTQQAQDPNTPVNPQNVGQSIYNAGQEYQAVRFPGMSALTAPRSSALQDFARSSTVNPMSSQVANQYANLLGRQSPDLGGLQYWTQDVQDPNTPVNPQNLPQAIMNAARGY